MSVTESPDYAAIHQRLRNPVNGRASSELDIVAAPVARRLLFEQAASEKAARRDAKIAELETRIRADIAALRILQGETSSGQYADIFKPNSFTQVIVSVSDFYFVPIIHMVSQKKTVSVVKPRHVAMFLASEMTTLSLSEIARRMGGRDHTTAVHAVHKIAKRIEWDTELAGEILQIRQRIEAKRMGTCNVVAPAEIKEIISA